ncbi:hypothetical protein [uncultured Desulfovibrio sp.]|uniref:hypothetical protein n=1 Tax=uncultured Desulfovibrio sp. TaxID=167968 RepID=UPI00261C35AE|nr:hypothetical protein [uncultured Desulfovibrio sp.]
MRKKIMIIISLLVLSSFSLVGCEEKKEPTADEIAKKEKGNMVQGGDPSKVHGIFDDLDTKEIGKNIKK